MKDLVFITHSLLNAFKRLDEDDLRAHFNVPKTISESSLFGYCHQKASRNPLHLGEMMRFHDLVLDDPIQEGYTMDDYKKIVPNLLHEIMRRFKHSNWDDRPHFNKMTIKGVVLEVTYYPQNKKYAVTWDQNGPGGRKGFTVIGRTLTVYPETSEQDVLNLAQRLKIKAD